MLWTRLARPILVVARARRSRYAGKPAGMIPVVSEDPAGPDLRGVDVLVLDGLGPAVLAPGPRRPRVVHLRRTTDRRSPWRHLVDPGRIDAVVEQLRAP